MFDSTGSVSNGNSSGTYAALFKMNATPAVRSLMFTNSIYNGSTWEAHVYDVPISSSSCPTSPFVTGYRHLTKVNVPAGQTVVDTFPISLLLKPAAAGQSWCLSIEAAPIQAAAHGRGRAGRNVHTTRSAAEPAGADGPARFRRVTPVATGRASRMLVGRSRRARRAFGVQVEVAAQDIRGVRLRP